MFLTSVEPKKLVTMLLPVATNAVSLPMCIPIALTMRVTYYLFNVMPVKQKWIIAVQQTVKKYTLCLLKNKKNSEKDKAIVTTFSKKGAQTICLIKKI